MDVKNDKFSVFTESFVKVRVEEFMRSNPSTVKVANLLTLVANSFNCEIDETVYWQVINEFYSFRKLDFYDDFEESKRLFGEEEYYKHNIKNWKFMPKYISPRRSSLVSLNIN